MPQSTPPALPPSPRRPINRAGLAFALLLIAGATLTPTEGYARNLGTFCLGCGSFGLTDVVLNVFLFLPLGIALGRSGIRLLVAAGVGILVSAGVEWAQWYIPGRASTVRDVLVNGFGTGLGALIGLRLHGWLVPGRRATVLAWGASAAFLAAVGLTGVLLEFDAPGGDYYGQWRPDRGGLEQWRGQLDSVRVDSLFVPNGRFPDPGRLRAALRADTLRVRLHGIQGPPTRRQGAMFALMTDRQDEVLLIGPRGRDLVVSVRRRSEAWRMRAPDWRIREALATVGEGEPLSIKIALTARGGCVTVNGAPHCTRRPAAGSTWAFAHDFDGAPTWGLRFLNAVALLLLATPAALLGRSVNPYHRVVLVTLVGFGLPVVALSVGLAWPTLSEWAGISVAAGVGWWLNRRLTKTT